MPAFFLLKSKLEQRRWDLSKALPVPAAKMRITRPGGRKLRDQMGRERIVRGRTDVGRGLGCSHPGGEIYYNEFQQYYFIKESNGNLTVYRYNWPVRVMEKTEERRL